MRSMIVDKIDQTLDEVGKCAVLPNVPCSQQTRLSTVPAA